MGHAEEAAGGEPRARLQRPKSANPRQPVATYDRFEKIMTVADRVDPFFGRVSWHS